jgi:hypothetical protein
LQTKLVADPGAHYRRWFDLYRTWRFFEWEWVDVPPTRSLETYVMKKDGRFVESFFANQDIDGVGVVALEPGVAYDVAALETGASLGRIVADERGAAMVAVPPSRVQVVTLTPR